MKVKGLPRVHAGKRKGLPKLSKVCGGKREVLPKLSKACVRKRKGLSKVCAAKDKGLSKVCAGKRKGLSRACAVKRKGLSKDCVGKWKGWLRICAGKREELPKVCIGKWKEWLRACAVKLFELLPYASYRKIDTWLRKRFLKIDGKDFRFGYRLDEGNTKLKYVICRYAYPEMSTFAAAIQYLFAYDFITAKGLVPVADLEYHESLMEGQFGCNHAWECTFKQKVPLDQVREEKGVYVDTIHSPHAYRLKTCKDINGDKNDHWIHASKKNWRQYFTKVNKYAKKAWVFQDEITDLCRVQFEDRAKGSTVLGVSLREDFAKSAYQLRTEEEQVNFIGHPYVPEVEDTIQIIQRLMQEWNCTKLFVSTERWESICLFRQIFGEENVLFIPRPRITKEKFVVWPGEGGIGYVEERNYYASVALRDRFVPYSAEVLALSKCDYFVAAKSSGAIAAMILNGGTYRDIWIESDENEIHRY